MADTFEDPSKKRRLEDGTSAFAENTAESRKEKLETWLKPLDNEQLVKLLLDMYVFSPTLLVHSKLKVRCRSAADCRHIGGAGGDGGGGQRRCVMCRWRENSHGCGCLPVSYCHAF